MAVAPWIVSDELWELIEPVLPRKERSRPGGRRRHPDRQTLSGILFVLHTGIAWRQLPLELGFGSGVTCWRRLDEWQRACGAKTGPSPADRGRLGSKHHLIVDQGGIPLAFSLTGGNRHDVTQLIPLVDQIPAVRRVIGRPRRRPDQLVADRGYDYQSHRRRLRQRGIRPVVARRAAEHGSGLGCYRWVVERTFAGSTSSAACSSATNDAPTSATPSSPSAAA